MKQRILNLKKKLLLVELPEDVVQIGYSMFDNDGNCYLEYYTQDKRCIKTDIIISIDSKNYKLTDITEEQFQNWVGSYEWEDTPEGSRYTYKDYKDGEETDDYWDMYPFDTAKESFFSYLEANEIYFENPIERPDDTPVLFGRIRNFQLELDEWQEAEQKIWNKDNCWLFEIV